MIIARGQGEKGESVFILGLSRENVTRLTDGKPIHMKRDSHGDGVPEGWEILIFFGENELAMKEELEAAGAIGQETKLIIDPRL